MPSPLKKSSAHRILTPLFLVISQGFSTSCSKSLLLPSFVGSCSWEIRDFLSRTPSKVIIFHWFVFFHFDLFSVRLLSQAVTSYYSPKLLSSGSLVFYFLPFVLGSITSRCSGKRSKTGPGRRPTFFCAY